MHNLLPKLVLFALVSSLALWGCKKTHSHSSKELHAQPFKGHSCAACGMILREQSSPRGQVIHRDGKRAYFCSISDMLSYLEVPSPHGKAQAVYVEVMPPKANPTTFSPAQQPWVLAQHAHFILGVAKPRVMGVPVLVYANAAVSQKLAKTRGGQTHSWQTLRPAWRKLRSR